MRPGDPHVTAMQDQQTATRPESPPSESLSAPPRLTTAVTLAMAVAAGASAANVWYNQPMLGAMARSFSVSEQAVAAIPTATQLGFAAGILFLLPLGDRTNRRTVILWQLAATIVALVAAALAPNVTTLIVASAFVGAGGATAQQIVPFAAELAEPATRGRVVGVVMSGLLTGILLARVVSGAVAEQFGWRAMCWVGAGIAVAMALMLRLTLPPTRPSVHASYRQLLGSLIGLAREHPALRRATLLQALIFATISAFWSVLALLLEGPPFMLGSTTAGLFGLVGVAGILAAPLAGRVADKRGPHGVIALSIGLVAASFVLFAAWPTIAGLIIGVVLVDLGAQASMISNQSIIFGLDGAARGRINTVFMTGMFLGGALGSAGAGFAWALGGGGVGGWRAVCGLCLALALAAGAVQMQARRRI
jgi:predicted MFS family arabinose efflux permease